MIGRKVKAPWDYQNSNGMRVGKCWKPAEVFGFFFHEANGAMAVILFDGEESLSVREVGELKIL